MSEVKFFVIRDIVRETVPSSVYRTDLSTVDPPSVCYSRHVNGTYSTWSRLTGMTNAELFNHTELRQLNPVNVPAMILLREESS